MIGKLASVHIRAREGSLVEDPNTLYRDEVRMVIEDTAVLCASDDPAATLEDWAAA